MPVTKIDQLTYAVNDIIHADSSSKYEKYLTSLQSVDNLKGLLERDDEDKEINKKLKKLIRDYYYHDKNLQAIHDYIEGIKFKYL